MTRTYAVGDRVSSERRFDGTSVSYGYDVDGNLATVAYPGETLSFAYDGDGLRTSASNSVGVVTNEYDAATGWLASSRGADGTEVQYAYSNGGEATGVVSVAGVTRYALDKASRRTRIDSPAGTVRLGYCAWNGKVSAVTNANGLVASYAYDVMDRVTNIAWTYDAWGNVLSEDVAVPSLASLRYRFQGREWSAATGLINFRMRWYDAETGRWLSKDPVGLNGGINSYVFCENSPISFIDPIGFNPSKDALTFAKKNIGSRNWDYNKGKWRWKNKYKCNKFVADAYNSGDNDNVIPTGLFGTPPPRAADWYNGSRIPPGFKRTSKPKPGDIATDGRHVGIVSSDKTTISATPEDGVVENDWGFRETGSSGNKNRTRFYTYEE